MTEITIEIMIIITKIMVMVSATTILVIKEMAVIVIVMIAIVMPTAETAVETDMATDEYIAALLTIANKFQ